MPAPLQGKQSSRLVGVRVSNDEHAELLKLQASRPDRPGISQLVREFYDKGRAAR